MNLLRDLILVGAIAFTQFASADGFEVGVEIGNPRERDCRVQGNCGRDDWRGGDHRGGDSQDGDWRGGRDHDHNGDWGRDDDWGRGDGRRGFPKICYAQDRRGQFFMARGRGPAEVVGYRALETCRWYSRRPGSCRFVGCRPL